MVILSFCFFTQCLMVLAEEELQSNSSKFLCHEPGHITSAGAYPCVPISYATVKRATNRPTVQ